MKLVNLCRRAIHLTTDRGIAIIPPADHYYEMQDEPTQFGFVPVVRAIQLPPQTHGVAYIVPPELGPYVRRDDVFVPVNRSEIHGILFPDFFLLPRPMTRRPVPEDGSAARGVSTGLTSRGTRGRARQVGQPIRSQVLRRLVRDAVLSGPIGQLHNSTEYHQVP